MNTTDTNNSTDTEEFYNTKLIASTFIKIASQAMLNGTYAGMSLEVRCNELNETETHPGVVSYLSSEDKDCDGVVEYANMEKHIQAFVNESIVEGDFVHEVFLSEVVKAYSAEIEQRIEYINQANGFTKPLASEDFENLANLAQDFVCTNPNYTFVCGTAYNDIIAAEEIMGELSAQNHTL